MRVRDIVQILRPKQWTKNLLVFAALVFAQKFMDFSAVITVLQAFLAFNFLASSMYVMNDIADIKIDQSHPLKKYRLLAAGKMNVELAWIIASFSLLCGLILAWRVGVGLMLVALSYLTLIIAYTHGLKKVLIVDVLVIAFGFVLRAVAGAVAIGVEFSPWLLITTLFLALFLVLGKRRHELILLGDKAVNHRSTLEEYSLHLLDQWMLMAGTVTLISYALYTLWPETVDRFQTSNLIYTMPLVIYGFLRYFYLCDQKKGGGDPTDVLYADPPLLANTLIWIIAVIAIIYT